MSQFGLKVDDGTVAAMSVRQLRMFHAINYMLDTLESAADLDRSQVLVEKESGRLVIELAHRFDDRFSFAVTMQETSRRACVWYDHQSVTFYPDWHASPDGWIDEALRLVWDTLRGRVELEFTWFKGERISLRGFRYDDKGREDPLLTRLIADHGLRWYQRRELERFRVGFVGPAEDKGSPDPIADTLEGPH